MAGLSPIERVLLFYGTRLPNHPRKWWLLERLRRSLGVDIDRDTEVIREGLRWSLNPADFEHAGLFWSGAKDRWDLHHLRSFLGPGSVFLDIGANFGYYSLTLAAALDRRCEIHAFEPNPKTYARLLRHIEMNGMRNVISAHQAGLSDAEGISTLIERPDNSGASRLGSDSAGVPVAVTTLDAFRGRLALERIDAIKIDVEGHEAMVLSGGNEMLSRFKPAIVIEFWTTGLTRAGSGVDELAGVLDRLGYKLFKPARGRLLPISDPPRSEVPENVFCIHPGRPFPPLKG